jgi:type IV/VI secretion system ImpK/VasF family protein
MNYQYWQEISFYLDELDKERLAFEKNPDSPEMMDATRKTMVNLLGNLRVGLEKQLDKHHASLILFAIVAAVDEKMRSYDFSSFKVRWAPLQKDFYAAYTAGEVFFKSVDEILDDPNTPNIVYQVYFAMLKRGFQGKYQDSKTQINKYLEMLKDKIPVQALASKAETTNSLPQKKRRLKKWHCYSLSAGAFLLLFATLFIISNVP